MSRHPSRCSRASGESASASEPQRLRPGPASNCTSPTSMARSSSSTSPRCRTRSNSSLSPPLPLRPSGGARVKMPRPSSTTTSYALWPSWVQVRSTSCMLGRSRRPAWWCTCARARRRMRMRPAPSRRSSRRDAPTDPPRSTTKPLPSQTPPSSFSLRKTPFISVSKKREREREGRCFRRWVVFWVSMLAD
ncbi:hypothetical protein AGOR_G00102710 [Albula goreensis]|uniref:Uncharacterized protein n=1 Tax=Albula goreensis TaxID=1534307 RepID=A0A8T3DG97_9TELE|nr:hypothetical protein AGOR_G00102710 [Albula goreensis]